MVLIELAKSQHIINCHGMLFSIILSHYSNYAVFHPSLNKHSCPKQTFLHACVLKLSVNNINYNYFSCMYHNNDNTHRRNSVHLLDGKVSLSGIEFLLVLQPSVLSPGVND